MRSAVLSEHELAVQSLLEELVELSRTNTTATITSAVVAGVALVLALVAILI